MNLTESQRTMAGIWENNCEHPPVYSDNPAIGIARVLRENFHPPREYNLEQIAAVSYTWRSEIKGFELSVTVDKFWDIVDRNKL